MQIGGALTSAATKLATIYEDWSSPKESGSIPFPNWIIDRNSGTVCFVGKVYNSGWTSVSLFSSIPLAVLKKYNSSSKAISLSSQGDLRERDFYWNGGGITFSGGGSIGIVEVSYLY